MSAGGAILRRVFEEIRPLIKEGVRTNQIDRKVEELIRSAGGEPAFKQVSGYKWASCICINEEVVHTPPSDRVITFGALVTVDAGIYYQGFNTDKADTYLVGESRAKIKKFLEVGRQTLGLAIRQVRHGNYIADISKAIYQNITENGYYVVKELTGHGVGKSLHEDPMIPGFINKRLKPVKIVNGMALAIEVIYSQSKGPIRLEKDHWSLTAPSGTLTACFEETVAIKNQNTLILT